MKKYSKLFRRLSIKAETTTAEVRKLWESVESELKQKGMNEKNCFFIQEITKEVRKRLNIEEKPLVLDKFKKFL